MYYYQTLKQIAIDLGIDERSNDLLSNISVDTRLVNPGDLFVALPGQKTDGHVFLGEAAAKGAVAAIVKKNYQGPDFGLKLLLVEDPLASLQALAKKSVASYNGKIIGVTGSLGKTTVKEFTNTILKQKFQVSATPANYNSQIGLPLTLLNHVKGTEDVLVLEMAMSQKGHIKRLVEIAPPDIAVITKVAYVHAENFDSLEEIAYAKGEILSHSATSVAIVPEDFPYLETCRRRGPAMIQVSSKFPFPGEHHKYNFRIAAACAEELGMEEEEILKAVSLLKTPQNRFQQVEKDGALFINDSYNAALPSIRAALESLPLRAPGGRIIGVLTGLAEMGKFTEQLHRELGTLTLNYLDILFCVGEDCQIMVDMWQKEGKTVSWFHGRKEVNQALKNTLKPGDIVLLKGANKHQLWKVLDEI